jgi:NAD(P)-dependent dehydrogenase (short-subunit alcohol dehydrogenase family)
MFADVHYRIELSSHGGETVARLFDGSVQVLSLKIKFVAGLEQTSPAMIDYPVIVRSEPANRTAAAIVPGASVSGEYMPDWDSLQKISKRWGVADPFLISLLCFSSYLVGMELPGERALFSKLILNIDGRLHPLGPVSYQAIVSTVDSRFNQIRVETSLSGASRPIVSSRSLSFVRSDVPEEEALTGTPHSNELAGKVAVVIGASRGLGLAIKHALAVRSAEVYTIARSIADADSHRAIAGDAADLAAIMKLRERIVVEQGRLDFLVCNACPPIPSLRLEVNAVQRIEKYINEATSLTLTPLCAFLDLLNASSGCAVLISSQAVEQPVREWPHYLAAKQAVEMLGRIAVLQYPKTHVVAVRPPKLLTAMTNSPVSRSGASPAAFADRLVTHLEKPLEPGHFEFFS